MNKLNSISLKLFKSNHYLPIGEVTIKPENLSIVIGVKTYRGLGISTAVMLVVIDRLKALGYSKITNLIIYKWNEPSIKMHDKLSFICIRETDNYYIYELPLAN